MPPFCFWRCVEPVWRDLDKVPVNIQQYSTTLLSKSAAEMDSYIVKLPGNPPIS